MTVWGTAIGTLIAVAWVAFQGYRNGRPTMPSVAHAVEAATCGAMGVDKSVGEVLEILRDVQHDLEVVEERSRRMNETLVRLEDRSRRPG